MPFEKGKSGNPKGRPIGRGDVRSYARKHTEQALKTLSKIASDENAPPSSRVAAAQALLDRGWGKPTQTIEANVNFFDQLALNEQQTLLAALTALSSNEENADSGVTDTTH